MVMDRHYPPAKECHRVEYSVFFTLLEIFTLVEILSPDRVKSAEPTLFR